MEFVIAREKMGLCWSHQEDRRTSASEAGLSVPSVMVAGSQLPGLFLLACHNSRV